MPRTYPPEEEADQILVEPDCEREDFSSAEEYWTAMNQLLQEEKRRKAVELKLKRRMLEA